MVGKTRCTLFEERVHATGPGVALRTRGRCRQNIAALFIAQHLKIGEPTIRMACSEAQQTYILPSKAAGIILPNTFTVIAKAQGHAVFSFLTRKLQQESIWAVPGFSNDRGEGWCYDSTAGMPDKAVLVVRLAGNALRRCGDCIPAEELLPFLQLLYIRVAAYQGLMEIFLFIQADKVRQDLSKQPHRFAHFLMSSILNGDTQCNFTMVSYLCQQDLPACQEYRLNRDVELLRNGPRVLQSRRGGWQD